MRWALAACLFACGSRSDLSPPPTTDASVEETGAQDVDVIADVSVPDTTPSNVFLDGLGYINAVVVDDTKVYFSNFYEYEPSPTIGDGILSCPKTGCDDHPTLLVTQNPKSGLLVLDATNLYWPSGDLVLSCGLSGCNQPSTLATAFSDVMGNVTSTGLFAFTVNAYYHGTVNVCSMPGCTKPQVIADGQVAPAWVTFDAKNVYWTNTIASAGTVMQCAVSGCGDSPTVLAAGQDDPIGIAVDNESVYWAAQAGVVKCTIGGCNNQPTLVMPAAGGFRVIVDSSWIYTISGDFIVKCPASGCAGDPIKVTPPPPGPITDFAIDATSVWYAVSAPNSEKPFGGQILKAPK